MPKKCLDSFIESENDPCQTQIVDLWFTAANQHLSIVSNIFRSFCVLSLCSCCDAQKEGERVCRIEKRTRK